MSENTKCAVRSDITLSTILKQTRYSGLITYRANVRFANGEEDTLIGHCDYINGKLLSLDGDTYDLDDIVDYWILDENGLTVWINFSC